MARNPPSPEMCLICRFSKFLTQFLNSKVNFEARKFFSVFTLSTHGYYHPIALGLEKLLNVFLTPMGPLESFLTDSNHSQELSRQKREKALICGFSKFLTQFLTSEVNFGARKFFSRGPISVRKASNNFFKSRVFE